MNRLILLSAVSKVQTFDNFINNLYNNVSNNRIFINYLLVFICVDRDKVNDEDFNIIKNKCQNYNFICTSFYKEKTLKYPYGLIKNKCVEIYRNYVDYNEHDWLYFLDDDTILHERFFKNVQNALHTIQPNIRLIKFNQLTSSGLPRINNDQFDISSIDTGCMLIHQTLLLDFKFKDHLYEDDGLFAEEVYSKYPSECLYIPEYNSYYNFFD